MTEINLQRDVVTSVSVVDVCLVRALHHSFLQCDDGTGGCRRARSQIMHTYERPERSTTKNVTPGARREMRPRDSST